MLRIIRRRMSDEGGISIVEMLVALFILSVGLMALLNSFTVSTKSIYEQRVKSTATRVASEELERLRGQVWEDGFVPPPPTQTVSADGRDYTVMTTITDSTDPPGLKDISTTVEWTVAGALRSATSTTAVSSGMRAPDTIETDPHVTVEMAPNPLRVWAGGDYWSPLVDVTVTVHVVAYDHLGQVRVTWDNADGTAGDETINKAGDSWSMDIPGSSLVTELDAELEGELDFAIEVVGVPELATSYPLSLLGYDDIEPGLHAINYTSQTTSAIRVHPPHHNNNTCSGANRCQNIEHVVFWVTNAPSEATSATVGWATDGANSITITRQTTGEYAGTLAGVVTSTNPRRFQPGTLSFTLQLRNSAGSPVTSDGTPCPSGCPLQFPLQVVVG